MHSPPAAAAAAAASPPRLRMRELLEVWDPLQSAPTVSDLMSQVNEACSREQSRKTLPHRTVNEAPFPIPVDREAQAKLVIAGPLTDDLESFYAGIGTWDVPPSAVHEALRLRAAAPLHLGCMPLRTLEIDIESVEAADVSTRAEIDSAEQSEWQHMVNTKGLERCTWGCFDDVQFPLYFRRFLCPLPVNSLEASSLRSGIHADDKMMVTSLDPGDSAWSMIAQNVVNAISKDAWEISAAGGFCVRITQESVELDSSVPPDDWHCVICLGEDDKGAILTNCGHTFHARCLTRWLRQSGCCPLCRRKCRSGPAVVQEPMDFELQPWPMLPDRVIAEDVTIQRQDVVHGIRQSHILSIAAMDERRRRLADRFKCEVPRQSFFLEVHAHAECTGPAVVLARSRHYQKEVEVKIEQLESAGSHFTFWPVDGRWRLPPIDPAILARHSAMTVRLAARHSSMSNLSFALQRRNNRRLAQFLLRQCYRKTPDLCRSDHSQDLSELCTAAKAPEASLLAAPSFARLSALTGPLLSDGKCGTIIAEVGSACSSVM